MVFHASHGWAGTIDRRDDPTHRGQMLGIMLLERQQPQVGELLDKSLGPQIEPHVS
jgi:hypothetical protein